MVTPKICLICKERIIESWESACASCWEKMTDDERANMIVLNHAREFLRSCGKDITELHTFW